MRSRQRASTGTSSTWSGSASSSPYTSSGEPAGRDLEARALRDVSELLHLPAIAFVVAAAFLFVRVLDEGRTDGWRLGLYLAAVLATQLSIALHNSWCDRAADAVAKPWRLVPRGAIDPAFVLFAALGLLLLGLTLASTQGPGVLMLVAAGTAAGFVYNAWLKRTPWSWLPFALALPTLAVCSLLVAGRLDGIPFELYLIGVPLVLAIHLADAVGDIDGDRRAGSQGLAVRLGERRSYLLCWAGLLVAAIASVSLRPLPTGTGPAFALSLILLCIAVLSLALLPRAHRALIFASAVTLAVDHVRAVSV